jgi:hypothetical protein
VSVRDADVIDSLPEGSDIACGVVRDEGSAVDEPAISDPGMDWNGTGQA